MSEPVLGIDEGMYVYVMGENVAWVVRMASKEDRWLWW